MLKKNVFFNYIGQLYTSLIGIIVFPMYLKYIGEEAYGLIGFFVLLQAWMLLFDLGMSPTLSRQVAVSNTSKDSNYLRCLLRSLETVFLVIALIISLLMIVFRNDIAQGWLKIRELNIADVAICISLMGIMISIRWFASLYKSGINGYEKQVWINVVNIIILTLRMPLSLIIFICFTNSIVVYFSYQLIISIIEVIVLNRKMYNCMPEFHEKKIPLISPAILRNIMPFAIGTAYTAGIWVFLTQLDKLLLSKILALGTFGYFSLVATLVGGILMLSTPVSSALLPRMTRLVSSGSQKEMTVLYKNATRFISCILFPIASAMVFFPFAIIYGWTGNTATAFWSVKILPLYAIGNGLLGIIGFQYYLQYAYGKLKLHIYYNTLLACISIPAVYFFAERYGAIGTGYVWMILNVTTLLTWTYIIHNKFLPGEHFNWLFFDVLLPLIITLGSFYFAYLVFNPNNYSRVEALMFIVAVTSVTMVLTFFMSFMREIKSKIKMRLR